MLCRGCEAVVAAEQCGRDTCLRLLQLSQAHRWPRVAVAAWDAVRCSISPTLPDLQGLPQELLLSVLQDDLLEVHAALPLPQPPKSTLSDLLPSPASEITSRAAHGYRITMP